MNKICTNKEQSQKLVELGIDISTADMIYYWFGDFELNDEWYELHLGTNRVNDKDIPAWSLAALLDILPYPSLHSTFMGWRCDSYNKEGTSCIFGEDADNPIDACVEMILKLKALKLL